MKNPPSFPRPSISSDVFVLDSFTGKISADPCFPKPNGPKSKAKALATIDGKVYVLSFLPYYYWGVPPTPVFECFDSSKRSWTALATPPHYLGTDCGMREVAATYCYHFVFGRNIYLYSAAGVYCYDVDESPKE